MDRKKNNSNSNDFFSYFRFEASGDSELADFDIPNLNMDCEISTRSLVYGDDDNEDAMSCSYEGSGVNEHDESWCDDDEKRSEDEEEDQDVVYGTAYCEEEEDDDEVHDQQHHHKKKKKKKKKKKSCVFTNFDLGHEQMDEMEKNRKFWEACLAS